MKKNILLSFILIAVGFSAQNYPLSWRERPARASLGATPSITMQAHSV